MIDRIKDEHHPDKPGLVLVASICIMVLTIVFSFAANAYITSFFLSNYPGRWLSYLYIVQSVILIITGTFIGKFISRNIRSRSILCQILGILSILSGFLLLKFNWYLMPFIFCITIYLVLQIVTLNYSNYVALIMDIREYKRNTPWLVSSASIAGIIFGYIQSSLVKLIGINISVVMIELTLILALPIYIFFKPREQKEVRRGATKSDAMHYPLFNYIFIYFIIVTWVSVLTEFGFKYQLSSHYSTDQIASYISIFLSVCSLICVFLQLFMLKRIQKFYGLVGLLISFPLVTFIIAVVFSFQVSIITATLLYGCTNILYASFLGSSREQSLNVLPQKIRIRGKFLTKGIATPVGGLIAAFFAWVISGYLSQRYVGFIVVVTSVVLVYLAFKIKTAYQNTLKDALILRRFDDADEEISTYSSDELKIIVDHMMQQKNSQLNLLGIKLIPKLFPDHIPDHLIPFLGHESMDLRIAAIKAINEIQDSSAGKLLNDSIDKETNISMLCHLLIALEKTDPFASLTRAIAFLDNNAHPVLRAMACSIVLKHGGIKLVARAVDIIQSMMQSADPIERASAATSVERIKIGDLREEIKLLIKDPDHEVSKHAIRSASIIKNKYVIKEICQQLTRDEVSYTAVTALVKFGQDALPLLMSFYKQTDPATQIKIIKIIARIPGIEAEKALINDVDLNNIQLLNSLAKYGAYRASRERPNIFLKMFADAMLIREMKIIYALMQILDKNLSHFLRGEILSRIRLAKIRFLYWLVIAEKPDIMKVVPLIISHLNQSSHITFLKALELIETYITENLIYVDYLHAIFENPAKLDELNSDPDHEEFAYIDTWIQQLLENEIMKTTGEEYGMNNLQKVMVLRDCVLFNELPSEILLAIADMAQSREIYKGEKIYAKGDIANAIYIVASGIVEVRDGDKLLMKVKGGGFFGIVAILEDVHFKADAIALEDGVILYLEKEVFDRIVEDLPEVMRIISRLLIKYVCEIANDPNSDQKNLMQVFQFS